MVKKKFVLAKFIIFIIFVSYSVYFIKTIKYKFSVYKKEKSKQTNLIISAFDIRENKFYINNPESDFSIVKKLEKNKISEEESLKNEENKENEENEVDFIQTDSKEFNKPDEKVEKTVKEETVKKIDKSYYIQIGVFRNKTNAEDNMKNYKEYNSKIEEYQINEVKYYKLIIDGFESITDAEEKRNKIINDKKLKEIPLIRLSIN